MTPLEGSEKQIAVYRSMTGQERAKVGFDLYNLARTIVRQGVRHQYPQWQDDQVEKEVIRRFQLAAKVY